MCFIIDQHSMFYEGSCLIKDGEGIFIIVDRSNAIEQLDMWARR